MRNRTPIIAGNWKMNLALGQAIELVKGIHNGLPFPGEVEVIVAPTFLCLQQVAESLVSLSPIDFQVLLQHRPHYFHKVSKSPLSDYSTNIIQEICFSLCICIKDLMLNWIDLK